MSVNLGSLGGLSDIGKQFLVWQVLSQIANAILGPALIEVTQDINGKVSRVALSPPDAVDAVVRGYWDQKQGAQEASLSGIEGDRFQILVDNAGEPPGLETLLEMYRRGIIVKADGDPNGTSLEQGIRESRLKNKWVPAIEAIRTMVLTPGEAVAAAVRGNLPPDVAAKKAYEAGVDAADFATMVANAGNPPSPGELADLVHRGLIPVEGTGPEVLSYQQGIFEGDTKDKWWQLLLKAREYIPPPRTATALLKNGSITEAMAREAFAAAGLTPEWVDAYVAEASKSTSGSHKELTKAEILQLYSDAVINADTATQDLVKLGMAEADAKELVELQDAKRAHQLQSQVVSHLRTLYVAHKISADDVIKGLTNAGVNQAEYTQLLKLWDLERAAPVAHVTAAEVTAAVHYNILDAGTGLTILQNLGYSEWEAWLLLAVRLHAAPPGLPEPPRPPLAG